MAEGLHLNGRWREKASLLSTARNLLADPALPDWERELWTFISQWFDESPFVTVRTSGSTGIAKRIRIEKRRMVSSARMTLDYLKIGPGASALLCLSAAYIAGKMMVVRAAVGALCLTAVPPQGDEMLDDLAHVDLCAMVPLQVHHLLDRPGGEEAIRKVGHLLIGGGPVLENLERRLRGLPNGIYSTYGMTETVSHIALRRLNGSDASSLYRVLSGVRIESDARGCLVIDAPLLSDRRLYTTDVVRFADPFSFEVLGRIDHVINSGGIKHHPETIEKKLAPCIDGRFVVSSLPDEGLGEKLVLVIESPGLFPADMKRLRLFIEKTLPSYQRPKACFLLRRLPEAANRKPLRSTIREMVRTSGLPDCFDGNAKGKKLD